jgi:hypothetical protein
VLARGCVHHPVRQLSLFRHGHLGGNALFYFFRREVVPLHHAPDALIFLGGHDKDPIEQVPPTIARLQEKRRHKADDGSAAALAYVGDPLLDFRHDDWMSDRVEPRHRGFVPEDTICELPPRQASVLVEESGAELGDDACEKRTTRLREFVRDLIGIDDGGALLSEEPGR